MGAVVRKAMLQDPELRGVRPAIPSGRWRDARASEHAPRRGGRSVLAFARAVLAPPRAVPSPIAAGHVSPKDRASLPVVLVGAAAAISVVLALLEVADPLGLPGAYAAASELVTAAVCAVALMLAARRPQPNRLRYRVLAGSLAIGGIGVVALQHWVPLGLQVASVLGNAAFVVATAVAYLAILPAIYGRLDRRGLASAGLDGAIILLAGTTVLLAIWQSGPGAVDARRLFMPAIVAAIIASAGAAAVAALYMRAAPQIGGIWAGIAGTAVLGITWTGMLGRLVAGEPTGTAEAFGFTAGILVIAYGWLSWDDRPGSGRAYVALSRFVGDWAPIVAILVCVGLAAIPHPAGAGIDAVPIGTACVVLLTAVRQRHLVASERDSSQRLASRERERAAASVSLSRLEPAATPAETATRVCEEALRLDGIDLAALLVFGTSASVSLLAAGRRTDSPAPRATTRRRDDGENPAAIAPLASIEWVRTADLGADARLPEEIAARLCAASFDGPWFEAALPGSLRLAATSDERSSGPSRWADQLEGWEGSVAYAPVRANDGLIGLVAMGSRSGGRPAELPLGERLATVAEFAVVSGALIGPQIAEHRRRQELRRRIESVISERAFHPVFQPVVELETGRSIGFEALTRFADGARPDRRFVDAANVGMGIALETAAIREQLQAAEALAEAAWVSLNVSPALASSVVPLISALEGCDREIVIEITEHMRIDDYARLVRSLATVRQRARLAVDDAGAGYAGLRQILELRPDFVKLDISLVRSIDRDAAQQALVAGMAHFARNAGCELIAEGIETPGELETLRRLGVKLGQGFLLGRPAPVD